jgi:small subunit ribosomal protein S6
VHRYELTVVLRNKDLENLKGKMDGILTKHGVSVVKDEPWGLRKLAYMVDGEKEGYYAHRVIDLPPDSVKKIISEFRLNSDILRYLFVRLEEEKTA